jgi:hypothetical protein
MTYGSRNETLTSHEQGSHRLLPLNEDFDGGTPCSSKNRVFAIDTFQCKIACGIIMYVHARVYVSCTNVV